MALHLTGGSKVKGIVPIATLMAMLDPNTGSGFAAIHSVQASAALTATSLGNAAVTLTLPAPAAGTAWILSEAIVTTAGGTIGTLAAATLTLDGSSTTNLTAGDAFTIGGVTYTAAAALTGVAGQFLIGGSGNSDTTLGNLVLAINGGANSGNYVAGSVSPNPKFHAAAVASHNSILTALLPGPSGNSLTCTSTGSGTASFANSGVPANGLGLVVQINDGANLVFSGSIAAIGQEKFAFQPPFKFTAGAAVTITATAGGSGIITSLNAVGCVVG